MTPSIFILAGVVLLYFGAEGLVRGSASLAVRAGITPLVIGLTVVAFGTSMPELVVSLSAALEGNAPIAVGNVVGSNIGNLALILGIAALIAPPAIQSQVIRFDLPIVVLVSIALVFLLRDDTLSRAEGAVLFTGLVAYTTWVLRAVRHEPDEVRAEFDEALPKPARSAGRDLSFVAGGLVLLVAGARMLVSGAVTLAAAAGVSDAVIGLTIVAIGTSLPELATSLLAAIRRESDIAVGNVVGSNLFNIMGILGLSSMTRPLSGAGMSAVDLSVMALLTVALLPLMRTGFRLSRWEGGALLFAYAIYLAHLLRQAIG